MFWLKQPSTVSGIATTVVDSVCAALLDFLHIRHCKSLNIDRAWRTHSCRKVNGENYAKEYSLLPGLYQKQGSTWGKVLVMIRRGSIKEMVAPFLLCHYCEQFYSAQCLPQRSPAHMGRQHSGTQRNKKLWARTLARVGWVWGGVAVAASC